MRFYWLKDRQQQKQFNIYWEPGKSNLADCFTKHHSAAHHKAVRPIYLYDETREEQLTMKGCIKILNEHSEPKKAKLLKPWKLTNLTTNTVTLLQKAVNILTARLINPRFNGIT